MEGAVAIDRVSKALSFVLWTATATKLLLHGYRREALLALSCSLTALLWGACSWARRRFYVRHARWLTAAVLLQAHAVASAVCLAGYALTSGARRCGMGCCTPQRCRLLLHMPPAARLLSDPSCSASRAHRSSAGTATMHCALPGSWR